MRRIVLVAGAVVVLAGVTPGEATAGHLTCLGTRTTIDGTPGDDHLVGTPGPDVVAALGGEDRVRGRDGDDRLCGGAGDDILFDGYGTDQVDGGPGSDTLYACPDGSRDLTTGVERVIAASWGCP